MCVYHIQTINFTADAILIQKIWCYISVTTETGFDTHLNFGLLII
jgi:hypothetical protein